MRQAIVTKYLGPTNSRGARVKASSQAGSVTIPWDHELDSEHNHINAADALADKYEWTRSSRLAGGAMPDNSGYAFVLIVKE